MKLTLDVPLTPVQLAEAFCEMDDEEQAQVFIEAARLAQSWPDRVAGTMQWVMVGRHLRTCACSTEDAREMVRSLFDGMIQPKETAGG